MLVGRAFVFSVNGRALAAIAALALSVSYAALAGSATSTIRDPGEAVSEGFLEPGTVVYKEGFEPFDPDGLEAQAVVRNTTHGGAGWATVEPWPYGNQPLRGPYAPEDPEWPAGLEPSASNSSVDDASAPLEEANPEHGSLTWIYLPPETFAQAFPSLAEEATQAYLEEEASVPDAFSSHPQKASGRFYVQGAEQVSTSVHALVAGMGLIAAVLAAGAIRLETLARRDDLATLETLAGRGLVKRVIAGRAAVLSLAGVGVGLLLALGGTRALSALLQGLHFHASGALLVEVALVAFGASFLAGTVAGWRGLRRPIAERLGQRGTDSRRFPGPIRFFLVTPRLWAGVLAAAFVTTAIVAVLSGAGQAPQMMLGEDERTLVVGSSGSNPFVGEASRFLGGHAPLLDEVDAASPETFAPTLVESQPVMVRGVDLESWRSMDEAVLEDGRWPHRPGEATLGHRLAGRLDLETGDRVPVPGAHRPVVRPITVVGIHRGDGFAGDQLVTDLDTAGDLADVEPGSVNLVRLRAPGPEDREALEEGFGIEILGLEVEPERPVPQTFASAKLDVVNLAEERRSRSVSLEADGDLLASRTIQVDGETRREVEIRFPVPEGPVLDLSVNPQRTVDTRSGELTVEAPQRIPRDTEIPLTVLDRRGARVPGATVFVDGEAVGSTNDSGQVAHSFDRVGRLTLSAEKDSATGGTSSFVVDRSWANEAHLQIESLSLGSLQAIDDERARYEARLRATNVGGATFQGNVQARVANESVGRTHLEVAPLASTTAGIELELPLEAEAVTVHGTRFPIDPSDSEEEPVPLDSLLTTNAASAERSTSEEEAFLDQYFAQLDPVLLLVILLTFAHAALAVAFGVVREIRERRSIARTLRHVGASREDVGAQAARDAALSVVLPAVLGVSLAFLGLEVLQARGWPAAFGHTLPTDLSLGLGFRIVAGLVVVGAATAAVSATRDPSPRPRQGDPLSLDRLLGGPP